MTRILSNGLHAPRRRRSVWPWLLRDIAVVVLFALGILTAFGLLWAVLVVGGVE